MRNRAITPFRLLSAARRWPAASRGEFVRKFAGGRGDLEAQVRAFLALDHPGTGFLTPPLPRPPGSGTAPMGGTTIGGGETPGPAEAPPALASPAGVAPPDPGSSPASWVGRRVLSRFELRRVLAKGGTGTVYEAYDEVDRIPAAVKVLDRPLGGHAARLALVRREVACLRLLRLPGVVSLHDDGIEDDRYVLAMELVAGEPFPGFAGIAPWQRLALPALALAETLARVHALGVVHGDLKPLNVLVRPDGRPVVLDLGVSGGPAIDPSRDRQGPVGATVRYMSPEHARGDPVGPPADLYALGLMVYEALSGRRAHDGRDVATLYEQRRSERAPPLRSVAPTVEPEVAAWVDALLEPDPEVRSSASEAALARVPGHVELPARVAALRARPPGSTVPRDVVEALFTGPRPFHHLPEDGAEAVLARTDGTPGAIVSELVAWIRAGLARWDGDRVAVDRPALERLRLGQMPLEPVHADASRSTSAPGSLARLHHLIATDRLEEVPVEAERLGEIEAETGRSDAAQLVLDEGVRAARMVGRQAEAERLLAHALDAALDQGTIPAFDRLLYRVAWMGAPTPRLRRIERVVRAALALNRGEHARAEETLGDAGFAPDEDPGVMRCAFRVRTRCGEGYPSARHEAIVQDVVAAVARRPGDRPDCEVDAWVGWLRYRQGRYEDAVLHLRRAAAGATRRIRRIAYLNQEASAALELFELDDAERAARESLALMSRARHPLLEARATSVLRSVAYRRARSLPPDEELVEACVGLPPVVRASLTLTEAAFSWRRGETALAARILQGTVTPDMARAHLPGYALAAGFLFAVGADASEVSPSDLVDRALEGPFPGLTVQTLGLVASRVPALVRPHAARMLADARRLPRDQRGLRREVLSVSEALAYAGVTEPA